MQNTTTETALVLELARVETFTRDAFYGTPAYFGKVEWFNVSHRVTGVPVMGYDVSRIETGEVTVNGPRGRVHTGCKTLREAVEFIGNRIAHRG